MAFMDQFNQQQNLASRLSSIKQAANGDANGLINHLQQTNPNFATFLNSIQGKTPEQAFAQYGLDYNQFRGIL